MKRKYRAVDVSLWNNEKFRQLPGQSKLAFIYVLTHPQMTSLGAMRGTLAGLSAELFQSNGIDAFNDLVMENFIECDSKAPFLRVKNYTDFAIATNPKCARSWRQELYFLPACESKKRLIREIQAKKKYFPRAYQSDLDKIKE